LRAALFVARVQAQGKNSGPARKTRYFVNAPFYNTPHSRVNCQKRTNDSNPNFDKQTPIKMLRGFLWLFRTETMCKWLRFNSKKASNAVSDCQICKCSFSTKIGTGKLGRISTENQSQTSNRATTLLISINVCASLSPLFELL
jgi:hypothetical protein